MPGPNSAPNGDRSLVIGWTTENVRDRTGHIVSRRIRVREKLRNKGKLVTGKTRVKRMR
jgi:hypothetical protein